MDLLFEANLIDFEVKLTKYLGELKKHPSSTLYQCYIVWTVYKSPIVGYNIERQLTSLEVVWLTNELLTFNIFS